MLQEIFRALKGRLAAVPIFVTQHMPPTFTALMAEQLARSGERPVAEGLDGEPVAAGHAYVAPGGRHMTVVRSGDRKIGAAGCQAVAAAGGRFPSRTRPPA